MSNLVCVAFRLSLLDFVSQEAVHDSTISPVPVGHGAQSTPIFHDPLISDYLPPSLLFRQPKINHQGAKIKNDRFCSGDPIDFVRECRKSRPSAKENSFSNTADPWSCHPSSRRKIFDFPQIPCSADRKEI